MRKLAVFAVFIAACICAANAALEKGIAAFAIDPAIAEAKVAKSRRATVRPSTPKIAGIGVTKAQLAQMKRRLAVLNATTNRPVSAAIQIRDAKATFKEKFAANLAALESAETELKPLRDLRKAVKRTEKNLSKIVKTLQQAIKKASDEDEAALYQSIIDLLTEET